ncbi:MAG: hypothetical protein WCP21_04695 [Armatimonadota bacterium]
MRRSAVLILSALAMSAALAQAPAPDLKDPAAVGRAYLQACERWDLDAGAKLLLRPADAVRAREQLADEPVGYFEQAFKEMLCLPLLAGVRYAPAEAAVNGDECRIPVVVTYTMPQTLVLRKQPDGTWKVDAHETILSTTGAEESLFARSGEREQQADCLSNLKQLGLGLLCYAQDHDENLPPADKWCDEIMPYLKNEQVLKCPAAPDLACGYAFNAALSGVNLGKIERPAEMIILFDSELGPRNGSAPLAAARPPRPGRHNEGNNAAYVDGHVLWLKAQ